MIWVCEGYEGNTPDEALDKYHWRFIERLLDELSPREQRAYRGGIEVDITCVDDEGNQGVVLTGVVTKNECWVQWKQS